jgi:hypothetical protein
MAEATRSPLLSNIREHRLNLVASDPRKNRLVNLIKAGQRQNDTWKESWNQYTSSHLDGVRDPAVHTADKLQGFVNNVQKDFANEEWFKHPEKFIKFPRGRAPAKLTFEPYGPRPDVNSDPEMHLPASFDLRTILKEQMRASSTVKDEWWKFCDTFCGGTHDPARHPQGNLVMFLEAQGLLPQAYSK